MKRMLSFLALLLVALPFMNVMTPQTTAATSRVAIIKELSGTVQVKKAGGSKSFKAFAKMSLNQGDVLTTSGSSSAVLQFANGTSDDDKMSVSANTTLTFSKLSDRNGTRTKVSMFNGSAWVDVKSIKSSDDEFTLETPTAIMGVRGTHLLVSVDPNTGTTRLTVAAGVVNAKTKDKAGQEETEDVLPTQDALFTIDEQDRGDITIGPSDMDALMKQSEKSIVGAILTAAGEIVKENNDKIKQYLDQFGTPVNDEDRKKMNIESLLGAIVDNALKNGKITQDRVNELIKEAETQIGVKIDLTKKTIVLSEEEKRKQEEQIKKDLAAKQAAEKDKKAAEEERKKNEELLKKIEEQKKKLEEENKKAQEEKKKKAFEEYEKQLSELELKKFKEEQAKRNQESSGTTTTSSSSNSNNNSGNNGNNGSNGGTPFSALSSLSLKYTDSSAHEQTINAPLTGASSSVSLPFGIHYLYLSAVLTNSNNLVVVRVDGVPVSQALESQSGDFILYLQGANSIVTVEVKSSATSAGSVYTLQVQRQVLPTGFSFTAKEVSNEPDPQVLNWTPVRAGIFADELEETVSSFELDVTLNSSSFDTVELCEEYCGPISSEGIAPEDENEYESSLLISHVATEGGMKFTVSGLEEDMYFLFLKVTPHHGESYYFGLFVNNGISAPDWTANNSPFLIEAGDDSGIVPYNETSTESEFEATVGVNVQELSLTPNFENYNFFNYDMVVWDESTATVVPSNYMDHSLSLAHETNKFIIYVSDQLGLHPHTYSLTVHKTDKPSGIISWNVDYKLEGQSSGPVQWTSYYSNVEDEDYRYYVMQPTNSSYTGAKLSFTFDDRMVTEMTLREKNTEGYEYIYEIDDSVPDGHEQTRDIELTGLHPGNNVYTLTVKGSDYCNDGCYTTKEYDMHIVVGTLAEAVIDSASIKSSASPSPLPLTFTNGLASFSPAISITQFELNLSNDPRNVEVYFGDEEILPAYGSYMVPGLVVNNTYNITIKVFDEFHHNSPVIYTIHINNPGIGGV